MISQQLFCTAPSSLSSAQQQQRYSASSETSDLAEHDDNGSSSAARPATRSSRTSSSFALPIVFLLFLMFAAANVASGRLVGHHHRLQQQFENEETIGDDAEVVSMLEGKLMVVPSGRRVASSASEHVCAKVTDRNAGMLQSLSKSTGQRVLLRAQQHFKIAYCGLSVNGGESSEESSSEGGCALGSNCATIYRWTKALVHPALGTPGHGLPFDLDVTVQDQVLVPVDCLCVLNWASTFRGQGPIILE